MSAFIFTKALLIGLNYTGSQYELRGCHNDVDNIKELLISRGTKEENIIVLKEATRLEILRTFIRFIMMSKCDDILYFHYSGHGVSIIDKGGDESDGKDEVIFTSDLKLITDDELHRYLVDCLPPKTKLFTVFDCCHSGTILDLKYKIEYNENSFQIKKETEEKDKNVNNSMVISLSGSLDNQYASDSKIQNSYQGALTYCFIKTINELGDIAFNDFLEILKSVNLKLLEYGFVNQKPILTTNFFSFN